MPPPVYNMFGCLLSIIIQNYSVHIYPQICQKNFCTRHCARFTRNIIILYMRAICHRVRIYIYIYSEPPQSLARRGKTINQLYIRRTHYIHIHIFNMCILRRVCICSRVLATKLWLDRCVGERTIRTWAYYVYGCVCVWVCVPCSLTPSRPPQTSGVMYTHVSRGFSCIY